MDPQHLDELIALEDAYWWHVAKRQLVANILRSEFAWPGRLVEGGTGSARNLLEFRQLGFEVAGMDAMPAAVQHAHRRGLRQVQLHDLQEPWPFAAESVQVVVLLDVLEHMAEPVQVLRHARRVLEPGGALVLTVPAYAWLYGDWDRRLGHYRRYTAAGVKREARAAGLRVARLSHWNAFSLPAAVAVRGYQKCLPRDRAATFPRVSPVVNRFLLTLAGVERWWLERGTAPFGLSLVGVLRP